jgi:hypothetical protein
MTHQDQAARAAEIAAIAKGLTKAQRRALKEAVWNETHSEWRAFAMFPADRNLKAKGLTFGLWGILTPLGLAVRQHLLSQDATHD